MLSTNVRHRIAEYASRESHPPKTYPMDLAVSFRRDDKGISPPRHVKMGVTWRSPSWPCQNVGVDSCSRSCHHPPRRQQQQQLSSPSSLLELVAAAAVVVGVILIGVGGCCAVVVHVGRCSRSHGGYRGGWQVTVSSSLVKEDIQNRPKSPCRLRKNMITSSK
jgi:hypothetical protein